MINKKHVCVCVVGRPICTESYVSKNTQVCKDISLSQVYGQFGMTNSQISCCSQAPLTVVVEQKQLRARIIPSADQLINLP